MIYLLPADTIASATKNKQHGRFLSHLPLATVRTAADVPEISNVPRVHSLDIPLFLRIK